MSFEASLGAKFSKDGKGKWGQILLAGVSLALSVPVGFVTAHVITPFLWWMEVQTSMAFTAPSGPKPFVIVISVLFVWGVLYAITGMVIEHRGQRR